MAGFLAILGAIVAIANAITAICKAIIAVCGVIAVFASAIASIESIEISIKITFRKPVGRPPVPTDEPLPPPPAYHASIQIYGEHVCSGFLISPQHVLTASNCFLSDTTPSDQIKVIVGTDRLVGGFSCKFNKKVFLSRPNRPFNKHEDLALVSLKEMISKFANIDTIRLPPRTRTLKSGEKLVVSGFSPYGILQKSTMITVSEEACLKWYPRKDLTGMFCAVAAPGNPYCLVENGSPVTINEEYIIGYYSDIKVAACDEEMPHYFNYISSYLDSIYQNMN